MKVMIEKYATSISNLRKAAAMAFSTVAVLLLAAPAHANNLVTNGSFESLTNGTGQISNGTGAAGPGNTTATGWSTGGYNFVFGPGTADTTGTYVLEYRAYLTLWGTNNGGLNAIPASSPDGGNFLAADGDYRTARSHRPSTVSPPATNIASASIGPPLNRAASTAPPSNTGRSAWELRP